MVERPILFQGAMVRAILDGTKTETRRLEDNPQAARIQPGDMLWVRETFRPVNLWEEDPRTRYRADEPEAGGPWRPAIHMPRAASRILLHVTAVRVEALMDLDERGAKAEGIVEVREPDKDGMRHFCVPGMDYVIGRHPTARKAYQALWDYINPLYPWTSDPVVRVIQFEKVKP